MFMTAQHHPRVGRPIGTGRVFLAELALGELESVVTLYREAGDKKYEAACRRYLARRIVVDAGISRRRLSLR